MENINSFNFVLRCKFANLSKGLVMWVLGFKFVTQNFKLTVFQSASHWKEVSMTTSSDGWFKLHAHQNESTISLVHSLKVDEVLSSVKLTYWSSYSSLDHVIIKLLLYFLKGEIQILTRQMLNCFFAGCSCSIEVNIQSASKSNPFPWHTSPHFSRKYNIWTKQWRDRCPQGNPEGVRFCQGEEPLC